MSDLKVEIGYDGGTFRRYGITPDEGKLISHLIFLG